MAPDWQRESETIWHFLAILRQGQGVGREKSGSANEAAIGHAQPFGRTAQRQEHLAVGGGQKRLRRAAPQGREQRRRRSGSRCTVASSSSSSGAKPRASASSAAWPSTSPISSAFCCPVLACRRRQSARGVGQRHVGALRAQRRDSPPPRRARGRRPGRRAANPRPPAPAAAARRSAIGQSSAMRAAGNGSAAPCGERRVEPRGQRRPRRRHGHRMPRDRILEPGEPGGVRACRRRAAGCARPCAVSWAATSRACAGSSAKTSRSRKRRRPAAPSWNSRSICGVSQTAASRAATSAWLRGAAPSRRKTRRSDGPSGGVPVPMSSSPAWRREARRHRPGAAVPSLPRRARSAARAPRSPRPGTSSEIASSRLVLPLAVGAEQRRDRRGRAARSARRSCGTGAG